MGKCGSNSTRQEAPRFGAGHELCHEHPGYCEEHCDPEHAEAFIEWAKRQPQETIGACGRAQRRARPRPEALAQLGFGTTRGEQRQPLAHQ